MTTVLVHLISSEFFYMQVGVAAILFGQSLGMLVIGTAGTDEGMKLVKTVGADLAFNHNDKDYVQHIQVILLLA